MKNIFTLIFLSTLIAFIGCGAKNDNSQQQSNPSAQSRKSFPTVLQKGLEVHGGLDQWNKMKALTFSFMRDEAKEIQKTALDSRKCKIERGDIFTLGFDGEEVWVAPDKAAFGKSSARFYHNLIFYFYAMPFVLADPGIVYTEVAPRTIKGKTYSGVKISFEDGVGDAPDDYYIAYFDQITNEMYLLLYTVTYFNGAPNEKFNALVYKDWTDVNGLRLPKTMEGYKFAADTLGEKRYERNFEDIVLAQKAFPEALFARPAKSEIDSLILKK